MSKTKDWYMSTQGRERSECISDLLSRRRRKQTKQKICPFCKGSCIDGQNKPCDDCGGIGVIDSSLESTRRGQEGV